MQGCATHCRPRDWEYYEHPDVEYVVHLDVCWRSIWLGLYAAVPTSMSNIIPAILPKNLSELRERLALVEGAVREVHIDVVDGQYAPNLTWPYAGAGQEEEFTNIAEHRDALPYRDSVAVEVDVMVEDSPQVAREWCAAGASRVVLHADSEKAQEAAQALQDMRHHRQALIGVALSCDASPALLAPFAGLYDFVQVMGIARVGFQGEPFDSRAIALLAQLHAEYPVLDIQVDGGVGADTIPALIAAGASRLIVGSAIFESDDPGRELAVLESLAQGAHPDSAQGKPR